MILLMVARRNGVVDEDSDCEKKRKDGMRMMIKQKKMPMVVMVKPRVANGGDDDQTE